MKMYRVALQGTTPMLSGRQYIVPKLPRENAAEYEERTWRERLHKNERGEVVLSPLMVKNCLRDVAKYLSEQIPGKGKSTYTKHFKSGVMVFEPALLRDAKGNTIKAAEVEPLWLNVPSDGQTGGTKRVPKAFPQIEKGWKAEVEVSVLDEIITKDVLVRHLTQAGNFVGFGAMRVANGGISGRFQVADIKEVR
jgi:hypothetical protein